MRPPMGETSAICDLFRQASLTQLRQAERMLAAPGPISSTSVHECRKAVKRIRAIVTILRSPLGKKYTAWNQQLRTVNRCLSRTRDLDVCLLALDQFPTSEPSQQELRARLTAELNHRRAQHAEAISEEVRQMLLGKLSEIRGGLTDWQTGLADFGLIEPAVRKMMKRARRLLKTLGQHSAPEEFHALRKIVKLRLYWLEFLEPVWPRGIRSEHKLVDQLAHELGQHHDLALLSEILQDVAFGDEPRLSAAAVQFQLKCAAQQAELVDRMMPLAQRLFAEKPQAFARRWAAWVSLWQHASTRTEAASALPTDDTDIS